MPDHGEPFVSIVIPAYNEVNRLEAGIRALREYLATVPWTYEVIVVVEKCEDGTLDLVLALTEGVAGFQVIANRMHRGKGFAVRTGMLLARGEIAFFMDADLSTPLPEVDQFVARFAESPPVDVLVGNRQHAFSAILKRQSFARRKMGQGFNAIVRYITGMDLADTQCGFKAFRRPAREALFALQTIDGFAFDVELLLLAAGLGFKVGDMPVRWSNSPGSRLRIVRDSARMLRDAFRVRRIVEATLALRDGAETPG